MPARSTSTRARAASRSTSAATNYGIGPWHKITGGDDDIADLFPNIGNLTASDAEAMGGLVVVNDARGGAEAFIRNQHVTAASIEVNATENASILAFVETNVSASGGSAFGAGTVLAVNGQIVTNIVLSSADAYVEDSILTTTGGSVSIVAQTTSGIDATLDSALSTGDTGVGITLAFNSIGWKPSNILFNAVDAILGDPLISSAFNGEQPAATTASVTGSTITSAGDVTVNAVNAARLNSTVSNAADSIASAMFDAKGKSVGGILASNKVSTLASATVDDATIDADGNIAVTASDEAGIYSNVKIVSSSITTNDGGTAVLQEEINHFVDADYSSTEFASNLTLGQRVRIAEAQATDGVKKGAVYQWMGEDGPQDLATQDYTDLGFWKPVGETSLVPQGLNFTQSASAGVGGAIVLNDVNSSVAASVTNAHSHRCERRRRRLGGRDDHRRRTT